MRHPLAIGDDDISVSWVQDILGQNKDKNFVDRILNKDKYPSLDLGNGFNATHLMSWTDDEDTGKYIVYPTVVYDGKDLVQYKDDDALDYAMKTGEYISFDSPIDASWFSENYKKVWDVQK